MQAGRTVWQADADDLNAFLKIGGHQFIKHYSGGGFSPASFMFSKALFPTVKWWETSLARCRIALLINPLTSGSSPIFLTREEKLSGPNSTNNFPIASSAKLLEITGTPDQSKTSGWVWSAGKRLRHFFRICSPAPRLPNPVVSVASLIINSVPLSVSYFASI